jgi:hypothetical protein
MKNEKKYLILLFLVFIITSCSPFIRTEQSSRSNTIVLQPGHSVGQTFTARYNGLESIILYLEPGENNQSSINLYLRTSPQSSEDLRFSSLQTKQIKKTGNFTFQFSPIEDSTLSSYYLFIKNQGEEPISVGMGDYFSYLQGSLHYNHEPQDQQLFFKLGYNPRILLIGLFKEGFIWVLWLVASLFLFIIPGWALASLTISKWRQTYWASKFGISLGISFAIYPILLLWTDIVNIHLYNLYAWTPPIIGLTIIIWKNRYYLNRTEFSGVINNLKSSFNFSNFLIDCLLLVVIALTIAIRFWVIRTLEYPMWGDSYQHTMVAQLLIDNGGLFNSWQPYAEMQSFTYHFGFHTSVAVFHWVTGLESHQAVLILGQLINAFAVIALIPLANKINSSRWTAVLTVLFAGLLFQMPMYYVNWGRYTQLTGQVILPIAILLAWNYLEKEKLKTPLLIVIWIVWAGLGLTHYRVLIFSIMILPAYFLLGTKPSGWKQFFLKSLVIGVGAGIIFLPWFVHVFVGMWLDIFQHYMSLPANDLPADTATYNSIGDITSYLPRLIWVALPIILAFGFWKREKNFSIFTLWGYLVFLLANPHWFHLPGAGTLSNFAVFIAAYIPISIILAADSSWLIEWLHNGNWLLPRFFANQSRQQVFLTLIILIIVILSSFYGARKRFFDIEINYHTFVTNPDQRAFEWIRENTNNDDRFLVISFPAYGNSLIAGADAGWWIPLILNRQTTLPPLLYGSEKGPTSDYNKWINHLTADIIEKGINHPEVLDLLTERQINYIYIGQQRGRINNPAPFLIPEMVIDNPVFEIAYHQDGVWIFQIRN